MENKIELSQIVDKLKHVPGFDQYALNHLVEDTTPVTVLRILARFSVTLEESLPILEKGTEIEDPSLLWKAAHKLAGSAEMLGFLEFGQKSKKISTSLKIDNNINLYADEITRYRVATKELLALIKGCFPKRQSYL